MHSALIQNRQCRSLALHAGDVAIWTKSGEKICHCLRAVGNPLTTWAGSASSVDRNFSSGLARAMKRQTLSATKESSVVHQLFSSRTLLNLLLLIHRLSRYFLGIGIKVIKSYVWKIDFWNFDYIYRSVMFARFVLCSAFGFHFGKFCACSWHKILR